MARALEPKSIKSMLREEGIPLGGAIRAEMSKVLDDALFHQWEKLVEEHDAEHAAVTMFGLCSMDPSFKVPLWLEGVFKRHRAAIFEAVDSGAIGDMTDALRSAR